MQHKAVCSLFLKFNLHVSGGNHTQHHEYTKLTTASGYGQIFRAANALKRGQVDLCESEWRQVKGTRTRDSKPSGFLKYGEFIDSDRLASEEGLRCVD